MWPFLTNFSLVNYSTMTNLGKHCLSLSQEGQFFAFWSFVKVIKAEKNDGAMVIITTDIYFRLNQWSFKFYEQEKSQF